VTEHQVGGTVDQQHPLPQVKHEQRSPDGYFITSIYPSVQGETQIRIILQVTTRVDRNKRIPGRLDIRVHTINGIPCRFLYKRLSSNEEGSRQDGQVYNDIQGDGWFAIGCERR
jgi:hypothetical protein